MTKTESDGLRYLKSVFGRLPAEKKDYVLHTAKSLLEIQDGANYQAQFKKQVSHYLKEFKPNAN